MVPILAQIVKRYLPGYKIEELAAGEKIKASWLKRSIEAVISFYCIAPGRSRPPPDDRMPYLPGFERFAIA